MTPADRIAAGDQNMSLIEQKEGDLQVLWIPQFPMEPFTVDVSSPHEARKIMGVLAEYDLFQLKQNIKPDFCNVGGLRVFEDGEWVDWYCPTTGEDIDEWRGGKDV